VQDRECHAVVIGGGIIGSIVARHLASLYDDVVLLEARSALLRGASYANQARVHRGYHYPRSFLTGLRSRVNFPRFADEFSECVVRDFAAYYAIGRHVSKVTAAQFKVFCDRIGAPLSPAPLSVRRLFNAALVEDVFAVEECAFDAERLAARVHADLTDMNVRIEFGATASQLYSRPDATLRLRYEINGSVEWLVARTVFNCTYSHANGLLRSSGLPLIPLKHERAEMALVDVPRELRDIAVTVMCGPFFSLFPFPPRHLHTLSHVRYTPHFWWSEDSTTDPADHPPLEHSALPTRFPFMQRDAQRYLPLLAQAKYRGSIWETKTVLPGSDVDDSRPILFRAHHGLRNLHCIIGAKIDNVYDILDELERHRLRGDLM
jgi:glycine/D-amino acid oxidase-like deaminating enzyme